MSNDNEFRLTKNKRKSILSKVFSRITICVILLILQVALIASVYTWLSDYIKQFSIIMTVFTYDMLPL